jgi:hypothetical protein
MGSKATLFMQARILQVSAVLITGILAVGTAQAQSPKAFCGKWHQFCRNNCPPNVTTERCHAVCQSRLPQCLKTGCYPFVSIPSKCQGRD